MCGIAGYLGPAAEPIVRQAISDASLAQAHRGPDDDGILVRRIGEHCLGLAHRRLAILDLSPAGHQPMVNPETHDAVIFNGEIYNFRSLRHDLEAKGHRFRSNSDTEILLRSYEQWGVECLDRFRGMFAFALWDASKCSILLARDHAGIKPLYYSHSPSSGLFFGSEIRGMIASGLISRNLDDRGVASYLRFGAVQGPLTIFRDIRCLPPGRFLIAGAGLQAETEPRRYWGFPPTDAAGPTNPAASTVDELRTLLVHAVDRHLVSDLPVGVFLSGGLDSAVLTALAARRQPGQVRTFTVSFPDDSEWDEANRAKQLANSCGTEHTAVEIDRTSALTGVTAYLERMDQPTIDGLNTYLVSRAARQNGIVVALSGLGSDEIFGGYSSFADVPRALRYMRAAQAAPAGIRRAVAAAITSRSDLALRAKFAALSQCDVTVEAAYAVRRQLFSPDEISQWGLPAERMSDVTSDDSPCDPVTAVSRLELSSYMSNMLLRDSDVFSMASSLELRVPFLDRDLMEWCLRRPAGALLPPKSPSKYLLRQAIQGWLPEIQLEQSGPKRGFVVPLLKWSRGSFDEVIGNGCASSLSFANVDSTHLQRDFERRPLMRTWSRLWSVAVLGHYLKGVRDWTPQPHAGVV